MISTIWKAKFTKEFAGDIATSQGYAGTEYEKREEVKDNEIGFSYFVEKKYKACTVSGRVYFDGKLDAAIVDGKLVYTSEVTVNSGDMRCEWQLTGGEFCQSGTDNTEVGVSVAVYGDEIDVTFTTSQFGKQDGYGYVNTMYDDKGVPYTEISFERGSTDITGKDVTLKYTLFIGADGIKSATVVSDTNQTYYSCDLEQGEYDIVVTKLQNYYDRDFTINNQSIEIVTVDSDGEAVVNYFLDRFPEFSELIIHKPLQEMIAKDPTVKDPTNLLVNEDRPSLLLVKDSDLLSNDILNNEHVVTMESMGITPDLYAYAYQDTIDKGSSNGQLKALAYSVCPGAFYYRKDMAEEVLGTNDPVKVQDMISTWDGFLSVAAKMKKKGYAMVPNAQTIQYPLFDSREVAWVDGTDFTADDSIITYIKRAKYMQDKGYAEGLELFTENWSNTEKSFGDFCAPSSLSFLNDSYDYGLCMGPASFNWGGEYIVATDNCANTGLAELFLYVSCCNKDYLENMMCSSYFSNYDKKANHVPNNTKLMEECIDYNTHYGRNYFYNQTSYDIYDKSMKSIKASQYRTKYDTVIADTVVAFTNDYIEGKYKNDKEVLAAIEAALKENYGLE